ncbi:uncharacterized protein LOC129583342 [Paramacrobiotus metropolitanus]|uniref:uncharacterized protein LOC129583342 n=1 Tax=Paramacrobiotus metropolitanus TaxID=2943436 RepID=UPI0024463199|nr:uncharacterized protein LOC129583342 [Paramacrobiotus metropolitanus]
MELLRGALYMGVVLCISIIVEANVDRPVSWEAVEAALRDAEREALVNELYNYDERDKRGPLNFRFRGAKRNAEEPATSVQIVADHAAPESSRPKRSPYSFRFRGAKRAPSSGFFGMRGKKDEWDSYYNNQYDDMMMEEKRGPMNFRFRGA